LKFFTVLNYPSCIKVEIMIKNPILGTLLGTLIVGAVFTILMGVIILFFKLIGDVMLLILIALIVIGLGYEFWDEVLRDK
jgi:hypothetical protein